MNDWKEQLRKASESVTKSNAKTKPRSVSKPKLEGQVLIRIPQRFLFRSHGVFKFEPLMNFFDWSIRNKQVTIDFKECGTANYQAISLINLYCWKLKSQGCRISFELGNSSVGATAIWRKMGALGVFNVAIDENANFLHNQFKPLIAIRNQNDFKKAIATAEEYTVGFNVEYQSTLRHVISELLYNVLEHGKSFFDYRDRQLVTPSLIQFTWYQKINEIHFIVADIGVGIRKHLSQTYPGIESDIDAIRMAIKPNVSGTFGITDPYKSKDNAGVGLYISTNIIKKLKADMHIISGNGILHISPRDITGTTSEAYWPGTIVLVSLKLQSNANFAFHSMMQEFREAAEAELRKGTEAESEHKYYISIENLCGYYAEDKQAAIKIRNDRIIPNIEAGKRIVLDFENIKSAPHSFLSALLATPIKRLGMRAYKAISILNASPEIRETIDFILDENTE